MSISNFTFVEYPVEKNKFNISIQLNSISSDKMNNIINFIKIIFPEKIEEIQKISKIDNNQEKKTYILDTREYNYDFIDQLKLMKLYDSLNFKHVLVVGNKIPTISLSNSDIIIFEDEILLNLYFKERHPNLEIKNFNRNNVLIVDKRDVNIKIYSFNLGL